MTYFTSNITVDQNKALPYKSEFMYQGTTKLRKELKDAAVANNLHIGFEKDTSFTAKMKNLISKKESPFYEVQLIDTGIDDQYRYQNEICLHSLLSGKESINLKTEEEAALITEKILYELNYFGKKYEDEGQKLSSGLIAR